MAQVINKNYDSIDLYEMYLNERENALVEYAFDKDSNRIGFATYCFINDNNEMCCYIKDIFVVPQYRKSGIAKQVADRIVKRAGKDCRRLLGSVDPTCDGAAASMAVLLSYGMEPKGYSNGLIYFSKDLGE